MSHCLYMCISNAHVEGQTFSALIMEMPCASSVIWVCNLLVHVHQIQKLPTGYILYYVATNHHSFIKWQILQRDVLYILRGGGIFLRGLILKILCMSNHCFSFLFNHACRLISFYPLDTSAACTTKHLQPSIACSAVLKYSNLLICSTLHATTSF